jgi:hypothetical protein
VAYRCLLWEPSRLKENRGNESEHPDSCQRHKRS